MAESSERRTVELAGSAPMELSTFIEVMRRRHAALTQLRPGGDTTVASREDARGGGKRKRSAESLARREERAKRRRERDAGKPAQKIRDIDAEIVQINKRRAELWEIMNEFVKRKTALFERKAALRDQKLGIPEEAESCSNTSSETEDANDAAANETAANDAETANPSYEEEGYLKMIVFFKGLQRRNVDETARIRKEQDSYLRDLEILELMTRAAEEEERREQRQQERQRRQEEGEHQAQEEQEDVAPERPDRPLPYRL